MGIRAVAVYSDADAKSRHVRLADEAVRIGPPPARESYLAIDRILDAAKQTGAQAIHPGYGFLVGERRFRRSVRAGGNRLHRAAGGGDSRHGIEGGGQGSHAQSRRAADAGLRRRRTRIAEFLEQQADAIGYPVMIKANAGGGGKGMRRVDARGAVSGRARVVQARSGGCVRRRFGAARKVSCGAAPRRGAGLRRHARQHRQPVRARLLRAAAPSESHRRSAGAADHGGAARGPRQSRRAMLRARSATWARARSSFCSIATATSTSWR